MLTLYFLMAQNPIPHKSERLYRVQVDSWGPLSPFDSDRPERAPSQLTYRDAMAFLESGPARRQVAMYEARLIVEPARADQLPEEAGARVTTGDFFDMFDVPFLYGAGWDKLADASASQVVVLTRKANDRYFGGENSVGEELRLNSRVFTVVGVMDNWQPIPRFYDVITDPVNMVRDLFIPFALTAGMSLDTTGNDYGWKAESISNFNDWLQSEAAWIQYWAELEDEQAADEYRSFLDNYVSEQKKLGRFERPLNNRIHTVMQWMDYNEAVPESVKVLVGIGILFMIVCLLSSVSLLMTKFNGRTAEVSLRRALGASRFIILNQHLIEITVMGVLGGLLGVCLTKAGLMAMKANVFLSPDGLFRMNGTLIGLAFLLAAGTSLIVGLYPAYRACLIEPGQQLKTQ